MRHLLAPAQAAVLAGLAGRRALVAFDYDGTLAPIVGDRERAVMRPRTAALLAVVAARYPTAVVSGRARADVAARLGPARVRHTIGNHGLEPGPPAALRRFERDCGQARVLLEQALAGLDGVDVEDKRYSLAVHYRRARDRRRARAAIAAAVAGLPMAVRVVPGKRVVNVVPAGAPDKGDAVARLGARERAGAVLYVGDDDTDEDVFGRALAGLVAVRVGGAARSRARYYLRDQGEIDELLAALAALRRGPRGGGAPARVRTAAASGRRRGSRGRGRGAGARAARGGRRARSGARTSG